MISSKRRLRISRRFAGEDAWAAYVLGPIVLLARENGVEIRGLRVLISSDVPEGKGVGSSAAVEVAVLQAVAPVSALARAAPARPPRAAGRAAVRRGAVRRHGSDGGGMRPGGELLTLLCRPAEIVALVPLLAPLVLWVSTPVFRTRSPVPATGGHGVACSWARRFSSVDEYLATLERSAV